MRKASITLSVASLIAFGLLMCFIQYVVTYIHPGMGFTPWNAAVVYTALAVLALLLLALTMALRDIQKETNTSLSNVGF